jgi:hypothetical protein
MSAAPSTESILAAFHSNLGRELPQEISERARVDAPALVATVDKRPSYWHVPVRFGELTVGFMDFSLDGTLVRYGSRMQQSSSIGDLPLDLMDMNPADLVAKARDTAGPGATVEDAPILVADQSPTRLTWMFHGRQANGAAVRVYLTPQFAWSEAVEAKSGDRE